MASPLVFARGIARQITLAPETSYGVLASGPGQTMRRTSFTMDNNPPEIQSTEITPDSQAVDAHLGVPALQSSLAGQLSPGTYKSLFEALLRGTWTAGVSLTGVTDTSLAIDPVTGLLSLGSNLSNFFTTGFKKGDVVRLSGLIAPAVAMNGINLRTVNVAAHLLTFAPNAAAVAWTTGQTSVGIAVAGKKLMAPLAALQVDRSFSIEDWAPELSVSLTGLGIKPTSIALNTQPNGWTNFQCSLVGKTSQSAGAQVFTTPVAPSTAGGVRGAAGSITYAGTDLAYVTSFNLQLTAAAQPVPAIGSIDGAPNIFMGAIGVRGTLQALSTNDTMLADFINENEVETALFLPVSAAAGADFLSVYIGRNRLFSATRQDSDRAIMRSLNFGALRQVNGGTGTAWDNTTIVIQDSLA
jgi:hypothetical protein